MPDDLEWLLIVLDELTEQELRVDASDTELQALQRECRRLLSAASAELDSRAKTRALQIPLTLETGACQ